MPYKDPQKRRDVHREYMREKYNTDPEHRQKQLARVKTKYAEKAPVCADCGGPNPEAHHEDYDKPDRRVWLCRRCHRLRHPQVC